MKHQSTTFDLVTTIHASESTNIPPSLTPAHNFTVTLEPDSFTEEKYLLFAHYQQYIHHEPPNTISRTGFTRFLCNSPLHRHTNTTTTAASPKKLGSYHHLYRLNNRLIALSVLDLLPHAVSSVYFIYHTDFSAYSLGKISALREATLALEGDYEYLYMGYYIHSCAKMRYKGAFRTQMVLDLDTLEWDPLDEEMKGLMDERKWVSMSRERRRRRQGRQADKEEQEKKDEEEDLYGPILLPSPLEASLSQLSLLELEMPGLAPLSILRYTGDSRSSSSVPAAANQEEADSLDLDAMKCYTGGPGAHHEMQELLRWKEGSVMDVTTLKGVVAELACAVGAKVGRRVVVDFGGV